MPLSKLPPSSYSNWMPTVLPSIISPEPVTRTKKIELPLFAISAFELSGSSESSTKRAG